MRDQQDKSPHVATLMRATLAAASTAPHPNVS
jgi:hypothetical protein